MKKKVLIADDEKNLRWVLNKSLMREGYKILEAEDGEEVFKILQKEEPDLILLDYKMPKMDGMMVLKKLKENDLKIPVIMITAHGSIESAVEAMRLGAIDYISKPFDIEELKLVIKRALKYDNLSKEVFNLRQELYNFGDFTIIGRSKKMQEILEMVKKVASTSATVLILGESGTGKELIAKALHFLSDRRDKPYVKVNCAAIPENLLESELFGYEKGAFTGAISKKIGKFERADGGTIFLDEIGDMGLNLQAKLLRVLQEKELERLGGIDPIKIDVRIIAATNKNLEEMVRDGAFREDLYYRLKVVPIYVPPLRERKEDIPLLVDYFLDKYSKEFGKVKPGISEDAMDIIKEYDWPGNIRELENTIERILILNSGNVISKEMLPYEIIGNKNLNSKFFKLPDEGINLEDLEKNLILQALEKAEGNQTKAAKLLGISRYTLIYRMEKYGIK